jgi:hypothetical protein
MEYGIKPDGTGPGRGHKFGPGGPNSDNFRDRVAVATGIELKIIDESEQSRLTFMAAQDVLDAMPDLAPFRRSPGGGRRRNHGALSPSTRPPAVLERLSTGDAPDARNPGNPPVAGRTGASGSSASTSAGRWRPSSAMFRPSRKRSWWPCPATPSSPPPKSTADWPDKPLVTLDFKDFCAFADKIIPVPAERLVKRFKLPFEQAETLGPGLFAYVILGRTFKVRDRRHPQNDLPRRPAQGDGRPDILDGCFLRGGRPAGGRPGTEVRLRRKARPERRRSQRPPVPGARRNSTSIPGMGFSSGWPPSPRDRRLYQ